MERVVKRRELTESGQLQTLVIDHVDGVETGLAVLDSRLLLGQATIDVVALDARGALVLMVVGAVADEEMLLRAVEAYSWCLEYPEAIRRLHPAVHVSPAQPPRLVFVFERMPDAFHRKIKQLAFPEVDCVEFRYLDVDGTAAVYFDVLARLRRGPAAVPTVERVVPPSDRPVTPTAPGASIGRPTSVKLQKLLGGEKPPPAREPAQVVSLRHRAPPRMEPKGIITSPSPGPEVAIAQRPVDEPSVHVFDSAVHTSEPAGDALEPQTLLAAIDELDAPALDERALEIGETEIEARSDPQGAADPDRDADSDALLDTMMLAVPRSEPLQERDREELHELAEIALEPEPGETAIAAAEPEPLVLESSLPTPTTTLGLEVESVAPTMPLELEAESVAPTMPLELEAVSVAPEPVAAEALVGEPEAVVAEAAVEPEAVVAEAPAEPEPVAAPAPEPQTAGLPSPSASVFARRTPEPVTTEERASAFSAFAKPGALKRPRTIAPPPPDPQPIAGAKLTTARMPGVPPAPAAPETARASTPAPAEPALQGFGALQFPNDGVLTRQWMEFLNQMAAGK